MIRLSALPVRGREHASVRPEIAAERVVQRRRAARSVGEAEQIGMRLHEPAHAKAQRVVEANFRNRRFQCCRRNADFFS